MLCRKILRPGTAIKIQVLDGDYLGEYGTHIYDLSDKILTVHAPVHLGEVLSLREGTAIKVLFWDDLCFYAMDTVIIKRLISPGRMFQLHFSEEKIYKIQRRKFVRVPAILPFEFRVIEKTGLSDDKKGTIIDLSGGGMRFQTNETIEKGKVIISNLELNKQDITIFARVIRTESIEGKMKFSTSAEFQDLKDRDRDRIIHFVFEIQRHIQTLKRKE